MTDCIFCKIIAGDIPSAKIYEDEDVYAFLDISQATPGHALIIPKQHVANIFEYDDALASRVFARVPKIARAIQKAFPEMQGLNLLNNNGEFAGQTVFHSHIHFLPRYNEADGFDWKFDNNMGKYEASEFQERAQRIVAALEEVE